jgi:hypothetical protein
MFAVIFYLKCSKSEGDWDFTKKYIVWGQVKVLQTMREIGNTAIHKIKEPKRSDLRKY